MFLQIAYSSASELAFQLTIATELQYGTAAKCQATAERIDHVQRMLNRLMVAKRAALRGSRTEGASSRGSSRKA